MANVLGVVGQCYKRGYEGKTFPKWARKGKNSPTWQAYQKGKRDRKNGLPSNIIKDREKDNN